MNTKMNKQFKQAVLAGGALAALCLGSMSAHAMRLSEAGEAQLVPFVLFDATPFAAGGGGPFGINTAVKITVPKSVGNDVIPNFFTATHSTPTNGPILPCGSSPGDLFVAGCETAADPDIFQIHWFFLDWNSQHVIDNVIPVTPEDVHVLDWGATIRQNGRPDLDGVPGYLVLTTDSGAAGLAADFSFFAETWMFFGFDCSTIVGICTVPSTGGVIGVVDALIPTLAMTDGQDTGLIGERPTIDNNVIENSATGNLIVSPLVTGIRTNWSDGSLALGSRDIKVVDLTLGNRNRIIGGLSPFNFVQFPTLLVVWNDRNVGGLWNRPVLIYNDQEESCSDTISLPRQLNLYWVQTTLTASPNLVPGFIETHGVARPFCVPPGTPGDGLDLARLLSGGFIKLFLPEPVDSGIFEPESAMVAFSIPLQIFFTTEPAGGVGPPVITELSVIPFETALGHDRGMFNSAPLVP